MDSDESPEKNWTNFIDSGEFKAVLEPSWNVPPAGGEITRENPDIQLETVASTSGELLQQSLPRFESEVERKSSFLSSLSGISGGDLTKEFEVNLTENVKKRRVREDSENRQKKPKRENENSQEGPKGHTLEESTFLEVEKRELQATQRGEPLESSQKDHIPRRNFFSPGFLPERFGVSAEELQTFMAEQSSKILRPEETQRASGSRSIAGVSKETSRLEKLIPMPKLHRESTRSSGESLEAQLERMARQASTANSAVEWTLNTRIQSQRSQETTEAETEAEKEESEIMQLEVVNGILCLRPRKSKDSEKEKKNE